MKPTRFGKYVLLEPLAAGGMGEIFLAKAGRHGADRPFAIKCILTRHLSSSEMVMMLHREAQLAIGLVHPNISQIFEFGELDGHFFLAMEYVEGMPLSELLRRSIAQDTPLPPADALSIGIQLCRALDYAHNKANSRGEPLDIVHRDVSPQNVLVDRHGMVKLIDFGIAKAASSVNLTETGFIKGKIPYMSPEQAQGDPLDRRSDIFAAGVLMFECLAQQRFYPNSESMKVLASLHRGELPKVEGRLPADLPDVVQATLERALAPTPEERYPDAGEMERDLSRARNEIDGAYTAHALGELVRELDAEFEQRKELLAGFESLDIDTLPGVSATEETVNIPTNPSIAVALPQRAHGRWRVIAAVLVTLAVAGLVVWRVGAPTPVSTSAAVREPLSVLISDFENSTGDDLFDTVLVGALTVSLEGAPFVSSYKPNKAKKVLAKIREGADRLGRDDALLVARREGIDVVVAGGVSGKGPFALSAEAIDVATDKSLAKATSTAPGRGDVLAAVDELARDIRSRLGDADAGELATGRGETFTTNSLEAAREYMKGQEFELGGRNVEATERYHRAVELDPEFGRAYAGLAVSYLNMKQTEEGEKYFREAMARMDRMTEREKLRTRSLYFLTNYNYQQAIDELERLTERFPGETVAPHNLALAYFYARDMKGAVRRASAILEKQPDDLGGRSNLALFAMYASDFDMAIREGTTVHRVNPTYLLNLVCMGMSTLANGDRDGAVEWYGKLAAASDQGKSLATMALADVALLEGRVADAMPMLVEGIAADREAGLANSAARKLAVLAGAHLELGREKRAIEVAAEAVSVAKAEPVMFEAARIFLATGRVDDAQKLATELEGRLVPEFQALARALRGEQALLRGDHATAVKVLREAIGEVDSWWLRFLLGRAYLEAGAYPEAHSELEQCLQRRGEATALFLDDIPTYRVFPVTHYYFGRTQEAMDNADAAVSYRAFLELRTHGDDELVRDARSRIEGLKK